MDIILGQRAGFCMGVALALHKLDAAIQENNETGESTVATFGPIIHNPQVLKDYEDKGVKRLSSVTESGPGMTVLIRAHGIPRNEEEALKAHGGEVIDATCPKVKRAQLAIQEATRGGERILLLYGEADHPEVRGLISYAGGAYIIFGGREELKTALEPYRTSSGSFVLAAQTTQDRQIFDSLTDELKALLQDRFLVLDTICDATRERQKETIDIAGKVDAMVVVGGKQSGNTRRLAEISEGCGVKTLLIETVDEIKEDFFAGTSIVGLTAGASTPKSIIDLVEQRLRSLAKEKDNL